LYTILGAQETCVKNFKDGSYASLSRTDSVLR
jgi:hypothetical protein